MISLPDQLRTHMTDIGLLYLRVCSSILVLTIHGLPKVMHYASERNAIEDPFHLGKTLTLGFAIFAELICPLFIVSGIFSRLAALPVIVVIAIALFYVHREWTLQEAQFAWMLLVLFGTIAIAGPGELTVTALLR